jgi:hypothetical protein
MRALVAWSMGWQPAQDAAGTGWMPPYLAGLLDDSYATPRFIAHKSLRTVAGFSDVDYDYVGSARSRTAAADRIVAKWTARPVAERRPAPGLLIDEGGRLDGARVARLLASRDNTAIRLQE